MPLDHIVRDRDEGLMRALPAFDLWLAAYPLDPFIGAGGRIAGLGDLLVFPADREYVGATYEQAPKERDLIGAGGRHRDGQRISDSVWLMIYLGHRRALVHEIAQHCLEFGPFGLNRGHSGSNSLDLYLDLALTPGIAA